MINKTRLVDEFCHLVSIDSLTFQERTMADYLKQQLTELGFYVFEDEAGKIYNGNCGNVYGFLQGDLEGEPILFSAHMDTVVPGINKKAIVHEDGKITSDQTTILGADDLAGVVSILEAIRTIKEKQIPHRSIEVLFPIAEEIYLRGTEVFDFSMIKAKEAYVLDLSGPVGLAALKAPTVLSFKAAFKGKAAHAGFAPETGIHAIQLAAESISHIAMGRIDSETTVNVGTIEGGLARNIVPEHCTILGEVRSLVHEKALREVDKIKETCIKISHDHGGSCEFTSTISCISYEVKEDHPVVKAYQQALDELGIEGQFISTFGASDNNNFMKNNITGIVMACAMNEVHSTNEYTHVEELARCSSIVMKLMTNSKIVE